MIDTRQKILDTAERLFGEQGYAATSLRQIIAEADVNLAAVHYHFGSKEELLDAVVMRKAAPLGEERLALLDRFEAEAGSEPVAVEKVLEAFLAPTFLRCAESPAFVKLMGQVYFEGLLPVIVTKHFQPVVKRFLEGLRRAMPGFPEEELLWRVHFAIGAMAQTLHGTPEMRQAVGGPPGPPEMRQAVGGPPGPPDFRRTLDRLVAFLAAGFRARVAAADTVEENK